MKGLRESNRSLQRFIIFCAVWVIFGGENAQARVDGTLPQAFQNFRVFGTAIPVGNTLMSNTASAPQVNTILLSASSAQVGGIPSDARIVSATLWWSGSINNDPNVGPTGVDSTADFDLPDGTHIEDLPASSCLISNSFDGFFYCHADVTLLLDNLANPNGNYTVGEVIAQPGKTQINTPFCDPTDPSCQSRYAGWSMIVVFDSPTQPTQRDVIIFDGFVNFDETGTSGLVPPIVIDGFEVGAPGLADISFFAMEGDEQLGIPPQNLKDTSAALFCTTCRDFMDLETQTTTRTPIEDGFNPSGNLYNSSDALGIDIDSFNVGAGGLGILDIGNTSATLFVGSGDGVIDPNATHGGGESVFLGWVLLTLTRPSPNFAGANTRKVVDFTTATPGQVLTYTIQVGNDGDQVANNVLVRDSIPAQTTYIPNSTRVNGVAVPDVGGTSPVASTAGLNLGSMSPISQGGVVQIVTFQVVVDSSASGNVTNFGTIASDEVEPPIPTNTVSTTIEIPVLGIPEKRVNDLTGPIGDFAPGDLISYTVTLKGSATGPVVGLQFVDDLPPFLRLIDVSEPGGSTDNSVLNGGVNGTGRVDVSDISIPQNSSVNLSILAQVFNEAEFNAVGVARNQIDGTVVENQGQIQADFLPTPTCTGDATTSDTQCTDDPTTGPIPDATAFTIRFAPEFLTSVKLVSDQNGGLLEPLDVLEYTIRLTNTGNLEGDLSITDDLPAGVDGNSFTIVDDSGATITFTPPPAGTNGTGSFTASVSSVPPGETREIIFTILIDQNVTNGTQVTNTAQVSVIDFPAKDVTLVSETLTVFATPALETATKAVEDLDAGNVRPEDFLVYTITIPNTGNRNATEVTVVDVIDQDVTVDVNSITAGGVFDVPSQTITWNIGTIAPGTETILSYQVQVNPALPNGTEIRNQAEIDSLELDPVLSDDPSTAAPDDPTIRIVDSAPDFTAATKDFLDENGADLRPGDTVLYTLEANNLGDAPATGMFFTDVVEANLTNVQPQDGGVFDAATRTITWNIAGTVNPGETRQVSFRADVASPLSSGTLICNQGNVGSDQVEAVLTDDPSTPDIDDPTCREVLSNAILSFEKTFTDQTGGEIIPGDTVLYTLTLSNEGDAPATGVVITDVVSSDLVNIVPSDPGVFDAASQTITWNIPTPVVPGTPLVLSFEAEIRFPLAADTVICNQGVANSAENAPIDSDDPATTDVLGDPTCVTVISAPDLGTSTKAVVDDNGGDTRPGDVLTYTVTVKNTGTEDATNVTISDPIDINLTVIETSISDGGVFDTATNTINWTLANVPAGTEQSVNFQAQILLPLDNGTEILNQAEVGADQVEPILTDDAATPPPPNEDDPTIVTVVSAPDFSTTTKIVTDLNGGLVLPGDTLLYTIIIKNTGDMIGNQTSVSDVVDLVNLENILPNQGGIFDIATGTITWNTTTTPELANVDISPAGDVELSFQAQIRQNVVDGTEIANQAEISHEDPFVQALSDDPGTADPNDPTIIVVGVPNVEDFTKEVVVQGGGAPEPLKILEYTLTVQNTGTAPATNVSILDPIDVVNLEQIVPGQGGVFANDSILWDATTTPELALLDPDETVVLTFTATIKADAADGAIIDNQASLSFADLSDTELSDDPNTADPDDPTRIIVSAVANFSEFSKEVADLGTPPFAPGDTILYTLTFQNAGPGFGRNVVVTDIIPDELINVLPGEGGIFDEATRTVTWNATTTPELTTVEIDTEVVLTIQADIVSPLDDQTLVSNQASLIDDFLETPSLSDDPNTPDTDDPTVFEVISSPLFEGATKVAVDVNGGLLLPGDEIRYTIRASNLGTQSSTETILQDAVPAQTTYEASSTTLNGVAVPDIAGNSPLIDGLSINSPLSAPGTILVGDENAAEISFSVRVDATAVEGTIISNQGFISSNEVNVTPTDDPSIDGNADPTQLVVGEAPNLSNAAKDFSLVLDVNEDGEVDVGDRIAFTITVTNAGSDIASNVLISDLIPEETALYAPGTLSLNGLPLSDIEDDDQGEVLNNLVTARVGNLAPSENAILRFEVDVIAGPAIINQGSINSDQTVEELTDSDGDDQNGDQPTVVPVGDDQLAILLVSKTLEDLNGGVLNTGDVAQYQITIQNVGTATAEVSLEDSIPAGTEFEEFTTVPIGATETFVPPPAGDNDQGLIQIDTISLPPGESAIVSFRVDVTAESGTEICNIAIASFEKSEDVQSEEVCAIVGFAAGTGGIRGQVFQDIGVDNQVFDAKVDRVLPGFTARVFSASSPETLVASGVVDTDGNYEILGLIPDEYIVKVFSEENVLFTTKEENITVSDGNIEENITVTVDPGGVVYEADNGRALAGARVFLFFDEEDILNPGELVPEDDLGDGQQGQQTGRLGLYQFDAPEGRQYRLVVEPVSATQVFPSTLIPPTSDFAIVGEENEVVSDDIPDIEDELPEEYYLRFDLASTPLVKNNHIPLDPLRALLVLDKRSFDTNVRIGEIVTYQIKIQNRSSKNIEINEQGLGGLVLQDALPKGFRFLAKSLRLERVEGDIRREEEIPDEALDTQGRVISVSGLEIQAGETIVLTYQTAIRLDVPPGLFENVAQGFIDSVPATEADTAKVRVELDPDFAESVLIGKVFCDDDKDGWQDLGEIGIPYVRIYTDTGTYVETDAFGKYHITSLNPGMHLAKVDKNTLPPPGTLTTPSRVLFHATSSLLQKANFGAECGYETAGIDKITAYAKNTKPSSVPVKELPPIESSTLLISGNVTTPALLLEQKTLETSVPSISMGSTKTVSVASIGRPYPLEFSLSAKENVSSWRVRVWEESTENILLEKAGKGVPPKTISIEKDTIPSGVYHYQLFVSEGDSLFASPIGTFWAQVGDLGREVFSHSEAKGALFVSKRHTPSRMLRDALKKASLPVLTSDEILRVLVYHDGSLSSTRALSTTKKRVQALKEALIRDFSFSEDAIVAVGMKVSSKKLRRADRKVVLRVIPKSPTPLDENEGILFEGDPFVYIDETPVPVLPDGSFARALDKDTLGTSLHIDLGAPDGQRVITQITLGEAPEVLYEKGAAFEGDLSTPRLSIDSTLQNLSPLKLSLQWVPRVRAGNKALGSPVVLTPELPTGILINRWQIRIVDQWGLDQALLEGEGAPPDTLSWDGTDGNGNYLAKGGGSFWAVLNIQTNKGALIESAPRFISIRGSRALQKYPNFLASGDQFDSSDKPTASLTSRLEILAKQLLKQSDQFYEIHISLPMPTDDKDARIKAYVRAEEVKSALIALGVPETSLRISGGGSPKFDTSLSTSAKTALHSVRIWRIAPIEAEALLPRVLVDGKELALEAGSTKFSGNFSGDSALFDLRSYQGSRILLTELLPRESYQSKSTSERFPDPYKTSGETKGNASTGETRFAKPEFNEGSLPVLTLDPFEEKTAASQPTSLPQGQPVMDTTKTLDPYETQKEQKLPPIEPETLDPSINTKTLDPFEKEEPKSQPSPSSKEKVSLQENPFLPLGGGGDIPLPKRRTKTTKSNTSKGQKSAMGDIPIPKRRTKNTEKKEQKIPLPKRRSSSKTEKAENTNALPIPKRRSNTAKNKTSSKETTSKIVGKTPSVSENLTVPKIASEETPFLPAIAAPVSELPAGTASSQPVLTPENTNYTEFGKEELETLITLESQEAALKKQGLSADPTPEETINASTLTVLLPPQGIVLRGGHVAIQGDTFPENTIKINGQAVPVDENGHFLSKVKLKAGENELLIESTDKQGNVAEVRRPVTVDPESYFVLALGDLAFGDSDAIIPEEFAVHNSTEVGPLFVQGRAALYFKGHIPGKLIFETIDVTAHVDTARTRDIEGFFENVIDPEKYYPVYGDSSQEVREASTRGPLYVLVEADESTLRVGSVKAALQGQGVDLFRYERTLYGIEVDFKKPYGEKKATATQVKAFISQDDRALHRVHNIFRGTGGSVYALSEDGLLEGAETLRIVVRDPNTGIELWGTPLRRYDDYLIDYRGGRVSLRDPLPSVVDSAFVLGTSTLGSNLLVGAPVFLEVDFESEVEGLPDATVAGGYARQSFAKGKLSLGAGYVQESRSNAPNYRLFGADLQAKWAERTYLKAEYAGSASLDAPTFASPDGGLSFSSIGFEEAGDQGEAFKISGAFALADLNNKVDKNGLPVEQLSITGYTQFLSSGFSSNGTIFDQGQNKSSLQVNLPVSKTSKLFARFDTVRAAFNNPDIISPPEEDPITFTNTIASIGLETKLTKNTWRGEISYLFSQGSVEADSLQRTSLRAGFERKLSSRLTLLLSQEAVVFNEGASSSLSFNTTPGLSQTPAGTTTGTTADGKILDGSLDSVAERLTTTAGLQLKLNDSLSVSLIEALRWDGSNATLLSLKTKLSKDLSAYATERFQWHEGSPITTTIIGAEQRFGDGGRSYGEYHIESAASGLSERAVLGIGKRWRLQKGLGISLAYEHSQFVSGSLEAERSPVSRDAAAGGIEWLIRKDLKASAKLEIRYDNSAASAIGTQENDRLHTVASAGITYRLTPDWTLFARALQTTTQNISVKRADLWDRLATFGFAYRPELSDRFNLLGKFSLVSRRKPTDLLTGLFDQEDFVAISLAPQLEISKYFGLASKFALRGETRLFESLEPQSITTMLFAARLNVHLTTRWDLGLEWRSKRQSGAIVAQQSGLLTEVAFLLSKYMRLGAGYNFTSFSDDELITDDQNAGGFFFRITGQY